MSITKERTQSLIGEYGIAANDTGSVEVQCAILTERINNLTKHLKTYRKDYISTRGLLVLVGKRKALLRYISKNNFARYKSLIERLGLRK